MLTFRRATFAGHICRAMKPLTWMNGEVDENGGEGATCSDVRLGQFARLVRGEGQSENLAEQSLEY